MVDGVSSQPLLLCQRFLPIYTCKEGIADTMVVIFLYSISLPKVKVDKFLKQAPAGDIISLLSNPPKNIVSSFQAVYVTKNAILELATILH